MSLRVGGTLTSRDGEADRDILERRVMISGVEMEIPMDLLM